MTVSRTVTSAAVSSVVVSVVVSVVSVSASTTTAPSWVTANRVSMVHPVLLDTLEAQAEPSIVNLVVCQSLHSRPSNTLTEAKYFIPSLSCVPAWTVCIGLNTIFLTLAEAAPPRDPLILKLSPEFRVISLMNRDLVLTPDSNVKLSITLLFTETLMVGFPLDSV